MLKQAVLISKIFSEIILKTEPKEELMIANLIAIIVGIVFIAFFAGFNLDNKCDVSLVFYTFKQIPVFFTILISFAVGLLCALPFALVRRSKKSKKIKNNKQPNVKTEKTVQVQSEQKTDSNVSENVQNSETKDGKTE